MQAGTSFIFEGVISKNTTVGKKGAPDCSAESRQPSVLQMSLIDNNTNICYQTGPKTFKRSKTLSKKAVSQMKRMAEVL